MISDGEWIEKRRAVTIELVGGDEVARMLVQYHTDNMSYRRLADLHGQPEATVRTRMIRARMVLRRLGLFPKGWETVESESDLAPQA